MRLRAIRLSLRQAMLAVAILAALFAGIEMSRRQLVAVKRYTFARIRFFRSSSFTSFASA